MAIAVREERPDDRAAIFALNARAFARDDEAALVDRLRDGGGLLLSLVAVEGEGATSPLLGHVAFSPVQLEQADGTVHVGAGLAPMAVVPGRQRSGIGGLLIREGVQRLRARGEPFCVVLGHPAYYPRFGFQRASAFGVRWEHAAPDEAFMALELVPGALVAGVVRYRPELDEV